MQSLTCSTNVYWAPTLGWCLFCVMWLPFWKRQHVYPYRTSLEEMKAKRICLCSYSQYLHKIKISHFTWHLYQEKVKAYLNLSTFSQTPKHSFLKSRMIAHQSEWPSSKKSTNNKHWSGSREKGTLTLLVKM